MRALESLCGARLLDRHLDAAGLRAVDALQIEQVSAVIDHRYHYVPVVFPGLGLCGGRHFLRSVQGQDFLFRELRGCIQGQQTEQRENAQGHQFSC